MTWQTSGPALAAIPAEQWLLDHAPAIAALAALTAVATWLAPRVVRAARGVIAAVRWLRAADALVENTEAILDRLTRNGGSSLADAIDRLEAKVGDVDRKVDALHAGKEAEHAQLRSDADETRQELRTYRAELSGRLDDLERTAGEARDAARSADVGTHEVLEPVIRDRLYREREHGDHPDLPT